MSATTSSTTASAAVSVSVGSFGDEAPCKSCVSDPACWQNDKVRTAQNVVSVCRTAHGVFFLGYSLLLVIIIIVVWLASNGSVSAEVSAAVATFISALVIILMGVHWYAYAKGVIPECCNLNCNMA